MTSQWERWCLNSPAPRLFTRPFIQGADQRKHQSSASLAFVWGIHRWPVNSSHKGPVTRKMVPFDDVIMWSIKSHLTVQSLTSVRRGREEQVQSTACGSQCARCPLSHWGRDKMAAIFQTTFWNGFSWMKMYKFRLKFHWNLFLWVQLTIFQHWFR